MPEPEPHPAEIRLAALRALLLEILEQPATAPVADPQQIGRALVGGVGIRDLCAIAGSERDEIFAEVLRLARGVADRD